jgi:hypothetical protein
MALQIAVPVTLGEAQALDDLAKRRRKTSADLLRVLLITHIEADLTRRKRSRRDPVHPAQLELDV